MDFNNIFTKKKSQVNCQEANNIWDLLASKYQFVEKLHFWGNYAHDVDLKLLLKELNKDILKIINMLEVEAEKYSIRGPEVGIKNVHTSINAEVIRDESIARDVFLWLQEITQSVLRAIKTATTNDEVRKLFKKINKINLKNMNKSIPYLRLKGWLEAPIIYPKIPGNVNEKINLGEVFHLWDHLTFRYDNIRQTEAVKDLVNDADLKALLIVGLQSVLKKQSVVIEGELLKFGIPTPKKPVKVIAWPSKITNFIKDDYIYRVIYIGIIGATLLHNIAVKQSVTNDKIRKLFIELLLSEVDTLDKFIIYGKMKGYLNEPPQFNIDKTPLFS